MKFKLTPVLGNPQFLDGGAMFGNAPRTVWETWSPPDALGRIPLACRAMLIEGGGLRVLCETGIGAFFEPKLAQRYGVGEFERHVLAENLLGLGASAESIDYVILSHLHFDHAGGLLPAYRELAAGREDLIFSHAKFVIGREAWERALHPHPRDRASFIPGLCEKLERSGRLVLVDGDHLPELWPERLRFRFSNGHTPGQMHTVLRGDRRTVIFCGDLVPGVPWIHLPITMGYDRFAEQVIDEKAELYQQAVAEDWLLFFTHDPEFAAATLQQTAPFKYSARDKYGSASLEI